MAAHKHAALMLLFAQDAKKTENPAALWEFRGRNGKWLSCGARNPEWWPDHEYRRIPEETVTYHCLFSDGSMSSGSGSLRGLQDRFRGSACQGKCFVKLTRLDGAPIRIEVVESE